jgi:hypothetical protein
MALEKHSQELNRFLSGPEVAKVPAENLLWATQALPGDEKEEAFLRFWPEAHIEKLDEPTFVSIAGMLSNENVVSLMKPVFEQPRAAEYVRYAVRNQAQVQSAELNGLLASPVSRLLKSDNQEDIDLGLDAVGRFGMEKQMDLVLATLDRDIPPASVKLALKAIDVNPAAGTKALANVANSDKQAYKCIVGLGQNRSGPGPSDSGKAGTEARCH